MLFSEHLNDAKAVLAKVDYVAAKGNLGKDDSEAVAVVEGLAAVAVSLAASVSRWPSPVTCTVQSGEEHGRRIDAALDVVEAIVTVADAYLTPYLTALPKLRTPSSSGGGGAMSLSMSRSDPDEEALKDATPRVLARWDLVSFALTSDPAQPVFAADSGAGKFFAALLANKPAAAKDVESAVNAAFRASDK